MANSLVQDTDLDILSVDVGNSNVEITPTITSGVKIADYVVDNVSGSLYTPGTAFAAESAYQSRFAEAAILADSAGAAQSAYNIRVYGTDANLYYDIPLYLDVSSELHVDNNNKLLYNPSTNILSATNIIVDNISANSISASAIYGPSIILGQQNNISGDKIYNMGYSNNISGRHVHNFGEGNTASNVEYSMNIGFNLNNTSTSSIQIGFTTAYYIEITPSGIYKILNGVRTSL